MLQISLSGEVLTTIAGFPVTNTLLTTWLVMGVLIGLSLVVTQNLSVVPGRFQLAIEQIVGTLHTTFEGVLGKDIKRYFPILATFFLFILISNWVGLIPGVGHAIGIVPETPEGHGAIPLLRAPTADLNTTLALALISFVLIQSAGIQSLGSSYFSKFFNFKDFLSGYVGILETISELGKIISFAFRLYGNIFAGEVLLLVVASIVPVWAFFAPLPFIGLEIFVGLIQALVFSMLTAVFLSVAAAHQEH